MSACLSNISISAADIRVDWDMFNIVQNDNKYVDIIMPIGEAFPKASDLLGNTSEPTVSTPLSRDCDTRLTSRSESSLLRSQKKNMLFNDLVSYSESKLDNTSADEGVPLPNKQLITVFIKPHEGVRSANPFNIRPKQMVLPARGVSAVEVTFHPSVEALNQIGSWLTSYALGYLSLDNECPSSVTRKSVHDVSPLRIDIMAELEHVRFVQWCVPSGYGGNRIVEHHAKNKRNRFNVTITELYECLECEYLIGQFI